MNELIVHNTQGSCRTELGFAIICGIRDIAQTWTNTEPNCSRLPKLCKTVSVIFLYMWHASRKLQVGEKKLAFQIFCDYTDNILLAFCPDKQLSG